MPQAALNLCVVSSNGRRTTGGLPAYTRLLVQRLAKRCAVSNVARFDGRVPAPLEYAAGECVIGAPLDGVATRMIGPRPKMRWLLRRLKHLLARRPLRGMATLIFNYAYADALRQAIPQSVDVIHYVGTGWELLGFTALKEARRRGAGFTVWPAVHLGTWGDGPLDIQLYNSADAVFVQSDGEKNHLAALGVDPRRLVRAWLAPAALPVGDGSRFKEQFGLQHRPIVLFIGLKARSKGYEALATAMTQLAELVPDVCLVAIGPAGDASATKAPAGVLIDLGIAEETVKNDALAACDVFCMPSAVDSFGIVYTEAWSNGKPVVGGPSPAVRELIENDVAGYCVEQDSAEIAKVLSRILLDTQLASRLGAAGRRLLAEKYNWETVTQLHLEVFNRLRRSDPALIENLA